MPFVEAIIVLLLFIILFFFAWTSISLAPWVPTRKKDLSRVLELAQAKPGQVFYDLGCGDGRLVRYMSQHGQMNTRGLELNFWLYLYSKIRSQKNEVIKFKNLFKEDLSTADIVFVFGMPDTIAKKLKQKLELELKPGAKVISYAFPIRGLNLIKRDKPTPKDISLYLYSFPLK